MIERKPEVFEWNGIIGMRKYIQISNNTHRQAHANTYAHIHIYAYIYIYIYLSIYILMCCIYITYR